MAKSLLSSDGQVIPSTSRVVSETTDVHYKHGLPTGSTTSSIGLLKSDVTLVANAVKNQPLPNVRLEEAKEQARQSLAKDVAEENESYKKDYDRVMSYARRTNPDIVKRLEENGIYFAASGQNCSMTFENKDANETHIMQVGRGTLFYRSPDGDLSIVAFPPSDFRRDVNNVGSKQFGGELVSVQGGIDSGLSVINPKDAESIVRNISFCREELGLKEPETISAVEKEYETVSKTFRNFMYIAESSRFSMDEVSRGSHITSMTTHSPLNEIEEAKSIARQKAYSPEEAKKSDDQIANGVLKKDDDDKIINKVVNQAKELGSDDSLFSFGMDCVPY